MVRLLQKYDYSGKPQWSCEMYQHVRKPVAMTLGHFVDYKLVEMNLNTTSLLDGLVVCAISFF